MKKGVYVISETSKGIGEAIAKKALDDGNSVIGISRSQS